MDEGSTKTEQGIQNMLLIGGTCHKMKKHDTKYWGV
jgi:hypothetical protein